MRIIVVAISVVSVVAAPSWTIQQSGVTARLRGVSAVSDRVVWASGSGNTILRSENGGSTWTKLQSPTTDRLDFRDIDAVSDTTAYLLSIGAGPTSRIYKTTDAGAPWALRFANADAAPFFDAVAFWDEAPGVAVSDSVNGAFVIIRTDDGGEHWTRIAPNKLPPALAGEGAFAASGTNVAVYGTTHVWFGTGASTKARVLRSTDRGMTWQVTDTPLASGKSAGIYSVAFRDPLHGVIVGGDYAKDADAVDNVAVTSDGGKTWTLIREKA